MHIHSFHPSLYLSVHKAAQPNTNVSALSPCFFIAHTHTPMHTVSLSLSLTRPFAHTPAVTAEALSEMGRLTLFSFSFFLYFFSLNEEMKLIIREKPLTQFPGSMLTDRSAFAKGHIGRKCFLMITV